MLFILRQLRRLELRQRSGRYFLYAFGEIALIMIGILLALQVSQWQEKQQLLKREALYLERAAAELERAEQHYQEGIERMEGNYEAVQYVMDALMHGQLEDDRIFSYGIYAADVLETVSHPITIYDEMISTGTFSQLQDEQLRDLLTQLKTSYDASMQQLPYFRIGLQSARAHLDTLVDWVPVPESERAANGGWSHTVSYDFEVLKQDRLLKNQFYEVVDSHGDWIRTVKQMQGLVIQCQERVDELRNPN